MTQGTARAGRTAEVVGAGFAGLAAACALAQRGWRVRVHERGDGLRTTGAGIYVYENGLRVLEALGAYDAAVATAPLASTREVRDGGNRVVSTQNWGPSTRVYSIVRQRVLDALADAARRSGVEIVAQSEVALAREAGEVVFADGRAVRAGLVVAADGVNSRVRDGLGLLATRRAMPDGAIRVLIPRSAAERGDAVDENRTVEYWSGCRRVLYTPCSDGQLYVALTMLDSDHTGRAVPIDVGAWTRSFPHLAELFRRIGPAGRYDRFEYVRLKRWSAGAVAVLGDAAHALPPNIGQGAGCAMMNALALAVFLDRESDDVGRALAAWERSERPLTQHTQRVSVFLGRPTTWPAPVRRLFFSLAGRSRWMAEQRTRTARHVPLGTAVR